MIRYYWIVCFYVGWIAAHYAATHAYVKYCTPATILGFVLSPLIASTPHCEGIRWVISTGGSNMKMMWGLVGVWVAVKITTLVR
jgi:hypothetical protein